MQMTTFRRCLHFFFSLPSSLTLPQDTLLFETMAMSEVKTPSSCLNSLASDSEEFLSRREVRKPKKHEVPETASTPDTARAKNCAAVVYVGVSTLSSLLTIFSFLSFKAMNSSNSRKSRLVANLVRQDWIVPDLGWMCGGENCQTTIALSSRASSA